VSEADPDDRASAPRLSPLLRYADIVDDVDALLDACARPLHRVVWANPLRAPIEQTARRLHAAIPAAERLAWHPAAWRLPSDSRPGNLVEYRLGHLHAQEEAALWAVPMLGALPGERVLDLCAAPGNKTAQLAIAVGERGSVVANERYRGRVDALRFNLDRLGMTNVVVTNRDGLSPKLGLPPFDRVLADVPC
jgi:16S rRNA C967 or C1407 C5-methylase (RsmB/RsmF family)